MEVGGAGIDGGGGVGGDAASVMFEGGAEEVHEAVDCTAAASAGGEGEEAEVGRGGTGEDQREEEASAAVDRSLKREREVEVAEVGLCG